MFVKHTLYVLFHIHVSVFSHCIFTIKLLRVVEKEDPHAARVSMWVSCPLFLYIDLVLVVFINVSFKKKSFKKRFLWNQKEIKRKVVIFIILIIMIIITLVNGPCLSLIYCTGLFIFVQLRSESRYSCLSLCLAHVLYVDHLHFCTGLLHFHTLKF